jgi:hypothetical protein
MGTNMPTGLDTLTNPTPTTTQSALPHSTQHANANDAIEAIEKIVVGPTYFNVLGYGAVGNNTGNDSSGVTAAYAAAPQGAIMRWPEGRYLVDPDILNIIASRRLQGDGQYATQIALRSNTSNPAIKINTTVAGPEAGIRGAYGPMVQGIGLDLGAAPSSTGIQVTSNSHWVWLDDVRIEGGTISYENSGPNGKITNCHFVNPSQNFMKLNNALELRILELIMTKTSGTMPLAIDLIVTSGGTGLFMTNVYLNNTGTVQKGIRASASAIASVPIKCANILFDNVAGPSWDLNNVTDVLVMGGWANSANGGNDAAVRIYGGANNTFMGVLMNGGPGSGSGWASVEFIGGTPGNYTFIGNTLNTGPYYRLTGSSAGDPVGLYLMDLIAGATIIDIGNLSNEPARLQAAMTRLWTPPAMAVAPMVRESGTQPPAGYHVLSAGSRTIAHTGVKTNTRVRVTMERPGGTVGQLYCSVADNIVGTSFTVKSTSATDTSAFYWEMYDAV